MPPDPMTAVRLEFERREAEERARRPPRDMVAAEALMKKIRDDFQRYGGQPWDLRDRYTIKPTGR